MPLVWSCLHAPSALALQSRAPTRLGPCSPTMMVQALTSPISFLSATLSEAPGPGPGPGPGEGEGAGPVFPRPLGCCMWPVMSLSRRVPAPCAAPSVRRTASPSVGLSVGALAALAAGTAPTGGRMRWRGARTLVPPGRRGAREGRKEGRPEPPPPRPLKGTSPPPQSWSGKERT